MEFWNFWVGEGFSTLEWNSTLRWGIFHFWGGKFLLKFLEEILNSTLGWNFLPWVKRTFHPKVENSTPKPKVKFHPQGENWWKIPLQSGIPFQRSTRKDQNSTPRKKFTQVGKFYSIVDFHPKIKNSTVTFHPKIPKIYPKVEFKTLSKNPKQKFSPPKVENSTLKWNFTLRWKISPQGGKIHPKVKFHPKVENF